MSDDTDKLRRNGWKVVLASWALLLVLLHLLVFFTEIDGTPEFMRSTVFWAPKVIPTIFAAAALFAIYVLIPLGES
jgi:hypothetical protein